MVNVTDRSIHSRRHLLGSAALVALAATTIPITGGGCASGNGKAASSASANPVSFGAFQRRMNGPIYSNPCPFTADLKLDDEGQRRGISRALKHGINLFSSTGGNTKYTTLSFDEVKQVNRVMIESVGGRGIVIAATGDWTSDQAASFAKYVEEVGADAVQVQRPKAVGEDEDGTVKHYEAVAKATKLPLVLHGKFTDALLARLVKIDSVEAMKEDHTLEDYVRQQIDFGKRLVIFGGGGENRIYVGWPYGANSYYSTYSTFAPNISSKVWRTIQSGDIRRAAALTAKYDYPYIRRFTHGQWHATLEIFGISTRYIRPPHKVYMDEQVKELRQFFTAQGISPESYGT